LPQVKSRFVRKKPTILVREPARYSCLKTQMLEPVECIEVVRVQSPFNDGVFTP